MKGTMAEHEDNQQSDPVSEARRGFLKIAIAAMTFMSGVVLGLPFVRTIIRSAPVKEAGWSEVTKLASLPLNKPTNIKFPIQSEDAFIRGTALQSVWIIRHSDTELSVFSPVCTHLGCYFGWNQNAERFECPCHGSVFSIDGKVLGGPAPRPLDTLAYKVDNGTLSVKWEHFKSGAPEKVQV
jgi:menaquinol-cytochrome c reductase iron-sulfur subunit